jgi:UDP-2,3-diacylglucosamine pyrophosphatase LpxH
VSPGAATRILALADLHMAAGRHDAFREDDQLVRFLEGPARTPGVRLLLLGDVFDFSLVELPGRRGRRLDTTVDGALDKLAVIAAEHPAPLAALAGVVAAGTRVDVVVGNHDLELMLPPVADRLCELLGGDVAVHPWLVHEPGLVYAEHGQQYHEINRVFDLLRLDQSAAAPVPAGSVAGEWVLEGRAGGLPLGATARLAFGLARWGLTSRRGRRYDELVEEHAAAAALPPRALAAIDGLGPRGPLGATVHLARRMSTRAPVPYMEAALGGVHEILESHAVAVPYYLAGHTHQVVDRPLAPDPGAPRYLSPGTWSTMRPPGAEGLHYVELDPSRARVVRWDA